MEELKARAVAQLEELEEQEAELGTSITEQLERVIHALKMRPGREPVLPETLSEELKMVLPCFACMYELWHAHVCKCAEYS